MGCGWIFSVLTGEQTELLSQTQVGAACHQNTYFFPNDMPIPSLTVSFLAAEVPYFSKDPTIQEAGQVVRKGR